MWSFSGLIAWSSSVFIIHATLGSSTKNIHLFHLSEWFTTNNNWLVVFQFSSSQHWQKWNSGVPPWKPLYLGQSLHQLPPQQNEIITEQHLKFEYLISSLKFAWQNAEAPSASADTSCLFIIPFTGFLWNSYFIEKHLVTYKGRPFQAPDIITIRSGSSKVRWSRLQSKAKIPMKT